MQEEEKISSVSSINTTDKSESKKTPTQPKKKEEAVQKTESAEEAMPQKKVPGIPKPSSTIKKGTSKVAETKSAKGKEKEMAPTTAQVRGPGGRFVKKEEKSTPESKAEPVPETEAAEETMSPQEVPGIPKPSSTIKKGTSKVAETKSAKGKEKEMAPATAQVRGPGGRFVKKEEKPTPESKEKPVPETEAVKESKPPKEVPGIPISSYTITRGTAKGPEKETAKVEKEEMAPRVEKKKESIPESKAEPVPKTEEVKEPEVKKDKPGIDKEETEEVVKTIKIDTGKVFVLAKTVSDKVINAIVKSIKSDTMKKTVSASMSAVKHPVNTISNFDRKVTLAMKKLTLPDIKKNNHSDNNSNPGSKNSTN